MGRGRKVEMREGKGERRGGKVEGREGGACPANKKIVPALCLVTSTLACGSKGPRIEPRCGKVSTFFTENHCDTQLLAWAAN